MLPLQRAGSPLRQGGTSSEATAIAPDGRPVEEHLAEVLVKEALGGKNRLAAVEMIFDRLEGRSTQHIAVADITRELAEKSDEELLFHLENNRWPTDDEKQLLASGQAVQTEERLEGNPSNVGLVD